MKLLPVWREYNRCLSKANKKQMQGCGLGLGLLFLIIVLFFLIIFCFCKMYEKTTGPKWEIIRLICYSKLFSYWHQNLWRDSGSLGLHIGARQGRVSLFCVRYWSFTICIHFATDKRDLVLFHEDKARGLYMQIYQFSKALRIQGSHTNCSTTWCWAWASDEVFLSIQNLHESCKRYNIDMSYLGETGENFARMSTN